MNDILDQARALVRGDRNRSYGSGVVEMERIGRMWGGLLDREPIDGPTVAMMMVSLKLVRATVRDNPDDLVDCAGYLLIAGDGRMHNPPVEQ